jgi:hypothetical protein
MLHLTYRNGSDSDEPPAAHIWALVSGLAGEYRLNRLLLMLQAYIDESEGDGIYVMAGYISTAKQGCGFSEEWDQFLGMQPKIKYFKFSEAMNQNGEFLHWREQVCLEKMAFLYRVIGDHVLASVSVAVRRNDYNKWFGDKKLPRGMRSPYYCLLYSLVSGLISHRVELQLHGAIDFTFDRQIMEEQKVLN